MPQCLVLWGFQIFKFFSGKAFNLILCVQNPIYFIRRIHFPIGSDSVFVIIRNIVPQPYEM